MEFRFLGETVVLAGDQVLDVGTPRQQAVLAALLVDVGHPVALEELIDRVWGDDPPVEARNVLYSHLSRIRRLLRHAVVIPGVPPTSIERRHAGYVMAIDPAHVDLQRFRRLVDRGRDPHESDASRARMLAEALRLWRGTPLAGIPGHWAAEVRHRWQRIRVDAVLEQARVELRLGRPEVVIATVPDVIAEHPLVEPLEEMLMRALHAVGRDAEALDRFAAVRQRLADELGANPGRDLRAVHQAILRDEPTRLPSSGGGGGERALSLTVPAQLPPNAFGFTGREHELGQLDRTLAEGSRSRTVVISAVSGTAGVGKTALALHWSHRIRDQFADGQLYVNLRGFDPTRPPMAPEEAVRGFLDAFEVPPERIPPGLEAQTGLYRSLLAGRRVLVLLDNARDSEQVRPLLPGVPGCLAIVTSRNRLGGLVATAGARPLSLDLLTVAESRELLARRLGNERVRSEPQAVDDIVACCARLPLALAIVASRAVTHPSFPLAAFAAGLRAAEDRLDQLADLDPASDVRAVFSWSYRQLSPDAARLFRLLGLHPGPDTSAAAAASLAAVPVGTARRLLNELTRAHLVIEACPGRFTFHDLLRAYAGELAEAAESDADRHAALGRMLDHYLHAAHAAACSFEPHFDQITLPPPRHGVAGESPSGYTQAHAWFTAEYTVLIAAVQRAHTAGLDTHASQLARTLSDFFDRTGHWQDWADAGHTALRAARRRNDGTEQAATHRLLGRAYVRLGRLDEADTHITHALELSREIGDEPGQAHAHRYLGPLREQQGRYAGALHHSQQALGLYRRTNHRAGQAKALNDIGWYNIYLGNYEQALVHCTEALELQDELGDRGGQAHTWDSLGRVHDRLGDYERAVACYQRSAELHQELGDHYELACTLTCLGDTHRIAGDPTAAHRVWQRAEELLSGLGHPDVAQVRAKLREFPEAAVTAQTRAAAPVRSTVAPRPGSPSA